jgi:hypothetical protein
MNKQELLEVNFENTSEIDPDKRKRLRAQVILPSANQSLV